LQRGRHKTRQRFLKRRQNRRGHGLLQRRVLLLIRSGPPPTLRLFNAAARFSARIAVSAMGLMREAAKEART
jgi:hypothetical protein